jgi:hypothetical protein
MGELPGEPTETETDLGGGGGSAVLADAVTEAVLTWPAVSTTRAWTVCVSL